MCRKSSVFIDIVFLHYSSTSKCHAAADVTQHCTTHTWINTAVFWLWLNSPGVFLSWLICFGAAVRISISHFILLSHLRNSYSNPRFHCLYYSIRAPRMRNNHVSEPSQNPKHGQTRRIRLREMLEDYFHLKQADQCVHKLCVCVETVSII